MIVPDYWAEARRQHRKRGRQVAVRRFGWSCVSAAGAQAMAEQRADEALRRILAGEKLDRREFKAAYNGANGVPIREEVLARHGEEVITRNSYGAHCLNTPRALFADIDFATAAPARAIFAVFALLIVLAVLAGAVWHSGPIALGLALAALVLSSTLANGALRLMVLLQGGHERRSRRRIAAFLARHAAWNLRIYRTPGGLRLLATHQPFDAGSAEVAEFFAAVGADPLYVRMCRNQQCFRARLTAKPWRAGISSHMRPRLGLWPVAPERMPLREQWVAGYERAAGDYAACHFIEAIGSGQTHREIGAVVALHDRAARALQHHLAIA